MCRAWLLTERVILVVNEDALEGISMFFPSNVVISAFDLLDRGNGECAYTESKRPSDEENSDKIRCAMGEG